jgi:hypothetical protein
MRRWPIVILLAALVATLLPAPGYAQDGPGAPLVLFIEDEQLATASVIDPGPDGLTELEQIFNALGARTDYANLRTPLPDDADLIVLVRPLRALPLEQIARLWLHLAKGKHLLLALDPNGLTTTGPDRPTPVRTETARSGLVALLRLHYGIALQDTFVAEPWFTNGTLTNEHTTYLLTFPEDVVRHPVIEPLLTYGLPVPVWGARSLDVEPFGIDSYAVPLIYTRSAYGEADASVFSAEPTPLEINLGTDSVGTQLVGALGENTRLGSRVAVLGDSEMLLNQFGLSRRFGPQTPQYAGNRILLDRLAAWLLGLPQDDWPGLPARQTWLAVDGRSDDWDLTRPPLIDDSDDGAPIAEYDIQAAWAFRDNAYMYFLIETAQPPNPDARITVGLETTLDGVTDATLVGTTQQIVLNDAEDQPVPDGLVGIDRVIEVRLPLRVTTEGALISSLCLADSRAAESTAPLDCTEQPPAVIPVSLDEAPFSFDLPDGPLVEMSAADASGLVNLRTGPDTAYAVAAVVRNGDLFGAVGRTTAGDWLLIQNAAHSAWAAIYVVTPNFDIMALPVVERP